MMPIEEFCESHGLSLNVIPWENPRGVSNGYAACCSSIKFTSLMGFGQTKTDAKIDLTRSILLNKDAILEKAPEFIHGLKMLLLQEAIDI